MLAACLAAVFAAACDSGAVPSGTEEGDREEAIPMSGTAAPIPPGQDGSAATHDRRAAPDPASPAGTIAVHLATTDGYFIEGFEIALRFETASGELVEALSWNEFVRSLGEPTLRAYYDAVLEQPVPAGEVVLLASVEVGDAAAPRAPDPRGDLRCRLAVDVPANGRVAIEVSFDREDCLHRS